MSTKLEKEVEQLKLNVEETKELLSSYSIFANKFEIASGEYFRELTEISLFLDERTNEENLKNKSKNKLPIINSPIFQEILSTKNFVKVISENINNILGIFELSKIGDKVKTILEILNKKFNDKYYKDCNKLLSSGAHKSYQSLEKHIINIFGDKTYKEEIFSNKRKEKEERLKDISNIPNHDQNFLKILNELGDLEPLNRNIIEVYDIIKESTLKSIMTVSEKMQKNYLQFTQLERQRIENLDLVNKNNLAIEKLIDFDKLIKYTPTIINEENRKVELDNKSILELRKLDVYEIISKMYDKVKKTDLKMLNINKCDLERENKRIKELKSLIKKLLILGKKDDPTQNFIYESISEDEVHKLFDLLKENGEYFKDYFIVLNKAKATLQKMDENVFYINLEIFKLAIDYYLNNYSNSTLVDIIKLSETFYYINDDKKVFLYEEIYDNNIAF